MYKKIPGFQPFSLNNLLAAESFIAVSEWTEILECPENQEGVNDKNEAEKPMNNGNTTTRKKQKLIIQTRRNRE